MKNKVIKGHILKILFSIIIIFTITPLTQSVEINVQLDHYPNYFSNNDLSNNKDILYKGSPGPIIAVILELWAKRTNQIYIQPTHELEFERVRQRICEKKEPLTISIVDVHGNAEFTSIQKAIDHSQPGDAVLVYAGSYHEEILIDKPLWLIGVSKYLTNGTISDKPNLSPISTTMKNNCCIRIVSKDVIVSGFHIESQTECLNVSTYATSIIIFDNKFSLHNQSIGVHSFSNNCSIIQNDFRGDSSVNFAIIAENTNHQCIQNNTFQNISKGIILKNCNGIFINQNNLNGLSNAIELLGSHITNLTFTLNNFIDNYENIFISTTCKAENIQWWNNTTGNYWDGYTGFDINNDGIGDSPYQSTNIFDSFPLISPFHNHRPNPARINPDEQGILCGKTNEQIPLFVEISDHDSSNTIKGKWIFGYEPYSWQGPYSSHDIIHTYHIVNSTGNYPVSIFNVCYITMDEYGLTSISEPYEVHLYDLQAIKNPIIRHMINNLMPSFFLSGWQ